jgi:hypothetical protein
MTTIKVLTDTLSGGYGPILEYYNTNKPHDWNPLRRLQVYEGGFEIALNESYTRPTDYNDSVKQLRWSRGCLSSGGYIGFNFEETFLLFKALQHSLGEDKVIFVKRNTY